MVTPDDVGKLVKDRTAAVSNYGAVVTGGTFFGRGPDALSSYPYTVFKIEVPDDAKTTSGNCYTQAFQVRLAAYAPIDVDGLDPQAVAKALFECFGTTAASLAMIGATLRNASERVLHCKPLNPDAKFDDKLREGRDVFVCGLLCELLIQGDRGVV